MTSLIQIVYIYDIWLNTLWIYTCCMRIVCFSESIATVSTSLTRGCNCETIRRKNCRFERHYSPYDVLMIRRRLFLRTIPSPLWVLKNIPSIFCVKINAIFKLFLIWIEFLFDFSQNNVVYNLLGFVGFNHPHLLKSLSKWHQRYYLR